MRLVIPGLITGFFVTIAMGFLAMDMYWVTFEEPAEQPIAFPHDVHAGALKIECTHCHVYVETSKHATVPAMQICMDCHGSGAIKSTEVDKLLRYWEKQEPIPWVRIHDLPDHVYFSHKRHIKAGEDCASCHGDMTVVKTVKKVRSMEMGFCVNCHLDRGAPRDCWTCHK